MIRERDALIKIVSRKLIKLGIKKIIARHKIEKHVIMS
jgi:hypothetical protein